MVLPHKSPEDPTPIPPRFVKQVEVIWRLNDMIPTLRPIAWSLARSLLMVAIALLLVMVLLPAVLEVQAASR